MRRVESKPRPDWQSRVEEKGLTFHSGGRPSDPEKGIYGSYWYEEAHYELTAVQVDQLEEATQTCFDMCLEAASYVLKGENFALTDRLGIPRDFAAMAKESWTRQDPMFYGRFDFAWDPASLVDPEPKLLEFNADTPTTLIETAITQYYWLTDTNPEADQFNSIHEKMVNFWNVIKPHIYGRPFYFTAQGEYVAGELQNGEDVMTVEYIRDTALQAGVDARFIELTKLHWDDDARCFVDENDEPIWYLFKLYPWEWMWSDEYGVRVPGLSEDVGIIEPAWKMVLSNKGILPILWEMFPNHKNLLEAKDAGPLTIGDTVEEGWVSKPMLGREGENVIVSGTDLTVATGGTYDGPRILQRRAKLFRPTRDLYTVIGSWVIATSNLPRDSKPAGCVFREGPSPVITGKDRVVPHLFR